MSDRAVVFVCRHGAVNSLIVAPQFQRLAAARGLPARSTFAGIEPDAAIPPNLVNVMRADGVDVADIRPRRVTRAELNEASHVVSFGCDLTAIAPGVKVGTTCQE